MHSPKSLRDQWSRRGFTLIEVMVGLFVLSTAVTLTAMVLTTTNRQAAIYRNQAATKKLLQAQVDYALGVPYSSNLTLPVPPVLQPTGAASANADANFAPPASQTTGLPAASQVMIFNPPPTGGATAVTGTMRRRVEASPTTPNLVRITYRLDYTFLGRDYRQEIYALRSRD